jgi:Endonuclease-reverse transcriptase
MLKLLYSNVQSLPGKLNEIEAVLQDLKPDIVLLCETWCNTNLTNAMLNIEGYNFQNDLRMDRTDTANGIGGGLAVYTKTGLEVLPCDTPVEFNQHVKFSIKSGSEKVNVYLIYRPPAGGQVSKEQLCNLIETVEKNSILVGDFNLPDINWASGQTRGKDNQDILDACTGVNLVQLVDFPTHLRGNTLDLVLTNIPERVQDVHEVGRIGRSDHSAVVVELVIRPEYGDQVRLKNWRRANWDGIRKGISDTVWATTHDQSSAETAWQHLRERLDELIAQHVPE